MSHSDMELTKPAKPGTPPFGTGYQSKESNGEWRVPLDSTLNNQVRVPIKMIDERAACK